MIGQTISHYKILGKLGEGARGATIAGCRDVYCKKNAVILNKRFTMSLLNRTLILVFVICCTAFSQQNQKLRDKDGHQLLVNIDKKTSTVKFWGIQENISHYGLSKDQLTKESVSQLGMKVIDEYAQLLNITSKELGEERIKPGQPKWDVNYKQMINGIPVYGSDIAFAVGNNISALRATVYPDVRVSTVPNIPSDRALEIAQNDFNRQDVRMRLGPKLYILPVERDSNFEYHLTWMIEMTSKRMSPKALRYFIGANDGIIIRVEDQMREAP